MVGPRWVNEQVPGKNKQVRDMHYPPLGTKLRLACGKADFTKACWLVTCKIGPGYGVYIPSKETTTSHVPIEQLPFPAAQCTESSTYDILQRFIATWNGKRFVEVFADFKDKRQAVFAVNGHWGASIISKVHLHTRQTLTQALFRDIEMPTNKHVQVRNYAYWEKYLAKDETFQSMGKPIREHTIHFYTNMSMNLVFNTYANRDLIYSNEKLADNDITHKLVVNYHTPDYITIEQWGGYAFREGEDTLEQAKKLIELVGWDKLCEMHVFLLCSVTTTMYSCDVHIVRHQSIMISCWNR